MTCQRVTALYVAQDIGLLYEGKIIKANKMLQVVEKKNRSGEIISLSKMSKRFVFLFNLLITVIPRIIAVPRLIASLE